MQDNNQEPIEKEKKEEMIEDTSSQEEKTKKKKKAIISDLKEQLEKEKDKHTRLFAEFENYKKRTSKERIEMFRTAGQDVIQSMLPVLDDFDRGIQELDKLNDNEFTKGVKLIQSKFIDILKSKGLEEITIKKEIDFNAELHEAITQIPAPKPEMKGKIIDIVEKGYKLGDKIIRFPKVVVGN